MLLVYPTHTELALVVREGPQVECYRYWHNNIIPNIGCLVGLQESKCCDDTTGT